MYLSRIVSTVRHPLADQPNFRYSQRRRLSTLLKHLLSPFRLGPNANRTKEWNNIIRVGHRDRSTVYTDVGQYLWTWTPSVDVDPINRIEKATPLHLAVKLEHPELRKHVVDSLLDAGADTSIRDKFGETALDLVPSEDTEVRALFRKAQAQASIFQDDIANDDDVGSGSGSGSDDD
ncbi:hypothetical protein EDD85DRAFT_778256 [Armillaria nabsnona]|nr:hypothetical protein EDD85DRAFT_778256 [Armillaria nabsnona]